MVSPGVTAPPTPLGLLAKAKTVKKPDSADTARTPRTSGECQPPSTWGDKLLPKAIRVVW